MISRLFFLLRKKTKYKKFHRKYKFSQLEINQILHKVKYNIPNIKDLKNFELLKNLNIDFSKSIYIENEKNLNFNYAKNIYLAQKIFDFNLIIFYQNESKILAYKKYLTFGIFIDENKCQNEVKNILYLLNVNTPNFNSYEINSEEKIELKTAEFLTKEVKFFALKNYYKMSNLNIFFNEYCYNGKYLFFNNLIKNNKKLIIFIKKILFFNDFNYFFIKKTKNKITITNLLNNKKFYIITNFLIQNVEIKKTKNGKDCKVIFNLKTNKVDSNYVVYFGYDKPNIFDKNLKKNVRKKIANIFNFKVSTNDKKFDDFINNFLPKEIIKNQNIDMQKIENSSIVNLKSINQILYFYKLKKLSPQQAFFSIKNLLVVQNKFGVFFPKCDLKNYTLKVKFDKEIKVFEVKKSEAKKIVVCGIEYQNLRLLSYETINQYNNFEVFV